MKLSANLGFLWNDRYLPDAIHAASAAGFDAVECHWPYDVPAERIATALAETGLTMLGLNTSRGEAGQNGLSALSDRREDARAAVDEALAYAAAIDAPNIHVMAGFADGADAHAAFVETLRYACAKADRRTILIEPLNHYDAPGYFLKTTQQANEIIQEVNLPNLKLMFDCYHVQLMEGDVSHKLARLLPIIGHIQVASVPDRGAPDHGELSYAHIWQVLRDIGWAAPVGAEYKPKADTDATLAWMTAV